MRAAVGFLILGVVGTQAQTAVLELSFWHGKEAAKDSRYVSSADHPCGRVAIARVSVLPGYAKGGPFISEVAVEMNANGKAIRRWPLPVDSYPIAIEGDRLLLLTSNGLKFWVTPRGSIALYLGKEPLRQSTAPCKVATQRGNSDYIECRAIKDLASGRARRIQFEAPCT